MGSISVYLDFSWYKSSIATFVAIIYAAMFFTVLFICIITLGSFVDFKGMKNLA